MLPDRRFLPQSLVGSVFGINNINAWIHPVLYQGFRLVLWCRQGIFSWHTLHHTSWVCLNMFCWPCKPIIARVYASSDGCLQQDKTPCHKAVIVWVVVMFGVCFSLHLSPVWAGFSSHWGRPGIQLLPDTPVLHQDAIKRLHLLPDCLLPSSGKVTPWCCCYLDFFQD